MRIVTCAALVFSAGSSAFAQMPMSTCMANDGHGRKVSQLFGPPAQQTQKRLQAGDWSGARLSLDATALAAQTRFENTIVAQFEMNLAKTTGDLSHLDAAWAPLIASGCMSEVDAAKYRSDIAAAKGH